MSRSKGKQLAIFISYSRADEGAVKSLAAGLDSARKEIWYDFDIQGGEPWWDRILDSIRTATLFLFALSDESLKSKPCMAEVNYAIALNRPILPVIVGNVDPSHGPLGDYQAIAYRPDDAPQAFRVFAAIEELTEQPRPLPDPLPKPPPIPFAYLLAIGRQIENMTLAYDEQLVLVDALKRHYRQETDATVRDKIIVMLESLKSKRYVAMEVANEISDLVRGLTGTKPPLPPNNSNEPDPVWWASGTNSYHLAKEATGSASGVPAAATNPNAEDDEARRNQKPVAETLPSPPPADPPVAANNYFAQQLGAAEPVRPNPEPPGRADGRTQGTSNYFAEQFNGERRSPTEPSTPARNSPPSYGAPQVSVPRPVPTDGVVGRFQQAPAYPPPTYPPSPQQFVPQSGPWPTTTKASFTQPPGPGPYFGQQPIPARVNHGSPNGWGQQQSSPPSPYWPLSIIAILLCILPGAVAIYYSSQVPARVASGDLKGARAASQRVLVWSFIAIGLGLIVILVAANA